MRAGPLRFDFARARSRRSHDKPPRTSLLNIMNRHNTHHNHHNSDPQPQHPSRHQDVKLIPTRTYRGRSGSTSAVRDKKRHASWHGKKYRHTDNALSGLTLSEIFETVTVLSVGKNSSQRRESTSRALAQLIGCGGVLEQNMARQDPFDAMLALKCTPN